VPPSVGHSARAVTNCRAIVVDGCRSADRTFADMNVRRLAFQWGLLTPGGRNAPG
jgi:hypothetical protein